MRTVLGEIEVRISFSKNLSTDLKIENNLDDTEN